MCIRQYVSRSRRSVLLNLVIFFFIWLLTHATYMCLEVLQSSINANLGITTVSILYTGKAVSSLLGPFIVDHLTPKWTLVAGISLQMLYIAANFYPEWYTMYIAGALMGFAIAPMWVCFGLYTTVLGIYYSALTRQPKAAVLSKFNGFLGISTPLAIIVGNFISSLVFQYISFEDANDGIQINIGAATTETSVTTATTEHSNLYYMYGNSSSNETNLWIHNNDKHVSQCNSHYCPQDHSPSSQNNDTSTTIDSHLPDQRVLYVLFTILLGINLLALLLVIFMLDNLPMEDIRSVPKVQLKFPVRLANYIKAFFNLRYLLLIPSIGYIYLLIAFTNSTFMKGYVTCGYGVELIGLVSMTMGICSCVITYIGGLLGQCIHRNYLFLVAFLTVLGTLGMLALWDVMPYQKAMLYVVAALIGSSLGMSINQFSAFLGDTFTTTKTEVFSFYQFFSGITMAAGFFSTKYLCTMHQIFLLIGTMTLSFVTFSFLSIQMYRSNQRDQTLEMETLPEIHIKQQKPFLEEAA